MVPISPNANVGEVEALERRQAQLMQSMFAKLEAKVEAGQVRPPAPALPALLSPMVSTLCSALSSALLCPSLAAACGRAAARVRRSIWRGGKDTVSAQKLGQLQPFIAVLPRDCTGQPASSAPA